MSRGVAVLSFSFVAGVSALVGAVVGGGPALRGAAPQLPPGAASVAAANAGPWGAGSTGGWPASVPPSFADIITRANASVVHIEVLDPDADPHEGVEGAPPLDVPQRGEGSGLVVDARGYILTNHHVVAGAERIRVHLADKRDVPATLVGTDPATDLALVRIDPPPGLRPARLGDSDRLRMGDWVCAIGSPLGFDHSATVGVVSSKGRKIWDLSFDTYIQTDAAINPGNSGGPLLNAAGEVVGINAAVSREGQGIGFAIPINVARDVLAQLRDRGKVTRGYLGVQLDELDPDYQKLLGVPEPKGALVVDVLAGGAGAAAGLRRYDVITAVSGRRVTTGDDLVRRISLTPPGSQVALEVFRDGRALGLSARLGERTPGADGARDETPAGKAAAPAERGDALGLRVSELKPETRRKLKVPADRAGVVIEDVLGWAAESDVIGPGDVIVEVDRRPTPDVRAYKSVLARLEPGAKAVLFVYRPEPAGSFLAKLEVERQ